MSAGLFYIFCDEKYLDLNGFRRIIAAYFAVPQDSWNRMSLDRRVLRVPQNTTRIACIEKLLHDTNGFASLTYADLESSFLLRGERDGTNDVPDMARYDNVWSAVIAYGLAATLGYLGRNRLEVKTVDLYCDTRSLKRSHKSALEKVITQTLPEIIRKGRRQNLVHPQFRGRVRRLEFVSKAPMGRNPDKFQAGVLVVHYLLQNANSFIHSGGTQRICLRDNTQEVRGYIKKFLGT